MTEAEPRRSVRATKGQPSKSFDELEQPLPAKKRQTKKTKKAQQQEEEEEEQDDAQEASEEVIRCVCGATEQDEDSGEAWISCETCEAWQHNICVGVSSFDDEIPEHYWCELCRPGDHQELLEGIKKGEKPWEERRRAFEAENEKENESKKKKKGGKKGRGKRASDIKDEEKEKEKEASKAKATASPAPQVPPVVEAPVKEKKETVAKGKRKTRDESQETDGKSNKIRRVSTEPSVVPVKPKYTPPKDLAATIADLPGTRIGPAKALKKSILFVMTAMTKNSLLEVPEGITLESMAETSALQIERAVFDTHPMAKGQKEYNQQIKSLGFNLKNNPELVHNLVDGTHTPPVLAIMTSDQLASAELQRQTAEMKAKATKAAILYTQEASGPRIRRTHKGEEIVEDDTAIISSEVPMAGGTSSQRTAKEQDRPQPIKNEAGNDTADLSTRSPAGDGQGQQSPSQSNFDYSKVMSKVSVRSPSISQPPRRPSAIQTNMSVDDPDVDRMLQEDNDSPPYSPTEESQDPSIVWRGSLAMSTIASFQANAKHVAGSSFAHIGPWHKLIPRHMTVAGRIQQQSATVYLCEMRYSNLTDVIVVALEPSTPEERPEFNKLVEYFVNKKRYGVVGDKVAGNVRDTYLIPVPVDNDHYPEFILNLANNQVPMNRTEPMLLAVFVWRHDPAEMSKIKNGMSPTTAAQVNTPTPTPLTATAPTGGFAQRSTSVAGPGFSPATPQPAATSPQTPVPIPQNPYNRPPPPSPAPPPQQQQQPQVPIQQVSAAAPTAPSALSEAQKFEAQKAGEAIAREVLGPSLITAATVQFLLPQAFQMVRREWEVIRDLLVRDARAKDDLPYLSTLIQNEVPRPQ